jgi:hypothetical protein
VQYLASQGAQKGPIAQANHLGKINFSEKLCYPDITGRIRFQDRKFAEFSPAREGSKDHLGAEAAKAST